MSEDEHTWKRMERNLDHFWVRVTCLRVATEIWQSASSLSYFPGPQSLSGIKAGRACFQVSCVPSRKQGEKMEKKITICDCKLHFLPPNPAPSLLFFFFLLCTLPCKVHTSLLLWNLEVKKKIMLDMPYFTLFKGAFVYIWSSKVAQSTIQKGVTKFNSAS